MAKVKTAKRTFFAPGKLYAVRTVLNTYIGELVSETPRAIFLRNSVILSEYATDIAVTTGVVPDNASVSETPAPLRMVQMMAIESVLPWTWPMPEAKSGKPKSSRELL